MTSIVKPYNSQRAAQWKSIQNAMYYFYLVFLCLLIYVRDVHDVNIPLAAFLLFFAVGYTFFDYNQAVAFTAIMPLLNHGIQTNYAVIIAIVFYLLKYGKGLRLNATHAVVMGLMLLEFLHSFIAPFSFEAYFRYFVQYFYLALVLGETRIKELLTSPLTVLRTFLLMGAYFMLDVFLITIKYIPLDQIGTPDFRFGMLEELLGDKPALFDNANMVALYAIIAIALTLVLLDKSKKYRAGKVLLILYFSFFGLLTASKTFLICLAIVILFYLFNAVRKSAAKTLGVASVTALLLVVLQNTLFKDLFAQVAERFLEDDITTGRGTLLQLYNEFIFSDWRHFFFGVGLQEVEYKTGIFKVPHNGIQEALVCWGIIGVIGVFILFARMLICAKHYPNKKAFANYIPFLMFIIFIQTIQLVRLSSIFGLLVVLYTAMLCGEKRGNKHFLIAVDAEGDNF